MSRTTYPFGPIRPPRPIPNPDPGNTTGGPARPPRVDPPVGPTPPANGGVGNTRPPRVDPPVGPVGPNPPLPTQPPTGSGGGLLPPQPDVQPVASGMPTDVRSAALARLLERADLYGDRGDSTKTLTDLLNGVDMGGAGRAADSWATRQRVLTDTGNTYTEQMAAALKAMRAKMSSGGGGRGGGSGGGRGGGGLMPAGGLTSADYMWLDEYMKGLTAPTAPKSYKATPTGNGYAASQHPVAPMSTADKYKRFFGIQPTAAKPKGYK